MHLKFLSPDVFIETDYIVQGTPYLIKDTNKGKMLYLNEEGGQIRYIFCPSKREFKYVEDYRVPNKIMIYPFERILEELLQVDIYDDSQLVSFINLWGLPGITEPIINNNEMIGQSLEGVLNDLFIMKCLVESFNKTGKTKKVPVNVLARKKDENTDWRHDLGQGLGWEEEIVETMVPKHLPKVLLTAENIEENFKKIDSSVKDRATIAKLNIKEREIVERQAAIDEDESEITLRIWELQKKWKHGSEIHYSTEKINHLLQGVSLTIEISALPITQELSTTIEPKQNLDIVHRSELEPVGYVTHIKPKNFANAMGILFYLSLSPGKAVKQCCFCGRLFTPLKRGHQEYCTDNCRKYMHKYLKTQKSNISQK